MNGKSSSFLMINRDAAKRMRLGGGNTAKNINARFFTHRFLFHSFP
jgi:hypothetical protein